jgi:transposase InsO family protein
MRHFIPCRDTCSAEDLAELYARHIFRLHGLPKTVISDRGPQFTAKFWRALCSNLKMEAHLSTPFHPETDGQTERMNAILEQYLRVTINYLQDDWEAWLHLAEFAGNNQASESTGISPFFANYRYDPLWQFEFSTPGSPTPPEEVAAQQLVSKFKEITEHLQVEMLWAQHRHQEQADKKRSPAPAFKVGDKVWFNTQNIMI